MATCRLCNIRVLKILTHFSQVVDVGFGRSDVFVYWKGIPERSRNGPDFAYAVTQVLTFDNGKEKDPQVSQLPPSVTTDAYALFLGLDRY